MFCNSTSSDLDGYHTQYYAKNTGLIADFLVKNYFDKSILIYGDGFHTVDLITDLKERLNLVGVIRQDSVDSRYIRQTCNSVKYYFESDISELNYDYIVLLGNWSAASIDSLTRKLCLEPSKILAPYRMGAIVEVLKQNIVNSFSYSFNVFCPSNKPILLLIIAFDRKDFITTASDELSKSFDLIKVYTHSNDCAREYHSNFLSISHMNGHLWLMSKQAFQKFVPDIAVYWVSSQYEMNEALYIKNKLPAGTKFILASSDLTFSGFYPIPIEHIGSSIKMCEEVAQLNAYAENRIIYEADGILSNFTDEYFTDIVGLKAKKNLFSYYFTNKNSFLLTHRNLQAEEKISLVMIGTVEFDGNDDSSPIFTSSKFDTVFNDILTQEVFSIDVYSARNIEWNDHDGIYKKLLEAYPSSFFWNDYVAQDMLSNELSSYHFGLALANLTSKVREVYKIQFRTLFQARVVSYIAAGLPIIVLDEYLVLSSFVKEYGVGISVPFDKLSSLNEIVRSVDYSKLKSNVEKFQQYYFNAGFDTEIRYFIDKIIGVKTKSAD